jgi:WD40 repeat protein
MPTAVRQRVFGACLLAASLCAAPLPATAQYFGANKVQYQSLDFRVLKTEHFDIYFHQRDREAVDISGRLAERWWRRLSTFFGREPGGRQPLVLYSSHVAFEQTHIAAGPIDAGTGGFTEPVRRRIAMPFARSLAETDHVLGHELVHVFQFDIFDHTRAQRRDRQADALPLWFVEGLAEFLTLGSANSHTAMWLRDAVMHDDLPSIADLEDSSYFPYRWGDAFWAYVSDRWGDHTVPDLFVAGASLGVRGAIHRVLGLTLDEFAADWHAALREGYPAPRDSEPVGRILIPARPLGGSTNVAPALSPDGRWMAFLSERSFFSIDLFVADAATGAIVAQLTDTAADPRYSNLQYIDSAGAWDPDGRRLAIGTVTSGRAAITVFRWPGGSREFDVVVDDVDEILNPTWSPDGGSIAFSAMSGGVTDLYVYDLAAGRLRRLTRDTFADMQPVWEPGGRRIAFVSDRFTTDADALVLGTLRLALIDVDSGITQDVPALAAGKHISPQWSPDGRWLYFVSDADGSSDLYRLQLNDGAVQRLTRAASGISGITTSSPALTVAVREGAMAVTVFERGATAIHELDAPDSTLVAAAGVHAVQPLPPIGSPAESHARWPADPSSEVGPVVPYRARLSLDRVTEASFDVGASRFGARVGTGVGLVFSDMLNTHSLITALQLNYGASVRDSAMYGAYLNRTRRWNWGVIGSSIPSYVGVYSASADPLFSMFFGPAELIRQTERVGVATVSYAFDRARRIEFQGGASRLMFERYTSVDDRAEWASAASSLTLGTATAALVRDTTSHGPLSPVRGERYRLEVAPTFGTIRYVNVLADYRRYFMPVPFYTLATRVFHFGRYGNGSRDPRVPPLYLGYPSLVRGYDRDSLIVDQCVAPLSRGCESLDQMLGSRIAVGNLELRFPLLRPFGVSRDMYGPGAVEVGFFIDAGTVWGRTATKAETLRGVAASAGVSLRTNVTGLGLGQFAFVRPFRNPEAGWVFQFSLVAPL